MSRGGRKLAAALDAFALDVRDHHCVDVGASTGGFTDCLLQRGAAHVVALDVGRDQLAWSLRKDERVTVMERTNVRDVAPARCEPPPTICVVDVSFISLRTVAPHLLDLTTPDADFVLLVKPQFEAGRARVGKGGVDPRSRSPARRRRARSSPASTTRGLGVARDRRVADHRRRRQRRVPRTCPSRSESAEPGSRRGSCRWTPP